VDEVTNAAADFGVKLIIGDR